VKGQKMKITNTTTIAAVSLLAILTLTSATSADGWGGTGGGWTAAPSTWSGEGLQTTVRSMQEGVGASDAFNVGVGSNRTGFSESFAEQDLTTDINANSLLGDPDCGTCENDSIFLKQSLFQRTGGLAYQRSEGGENSSSHAGVQSGSVGQMAAIADRYRALATGQAPADD
jgi:hypothetical protein